MKTIVSGVCAGYGDRQVLDGITFTLNPGEIVGLIGPNGHGKTTLMKRMLDLVPGTGCVSFDGLSYRFLAMPQRHIGVLLNTEAFHPRRSALNHLRMLGAADGITRGQAGKALERVGLGSVARATPASYSTGMKQRLGLAGALICEPELLILDEPTSGLDTDGMIWFRSMLRSLAQEGRTVLLSTHSLDELEKIADRVLVLHTGRIKLDCPLGEIMAPNLNPVVIVKTDNAHELARAIRGALGVSVTEDRETLFIAEATAYEIGALAHRLGHAVYELSSIRPTLEESYAAIVGADTQLKLPGQEA